VKLRKKQIIWCGLLGLLSLGLAQISSQRSHLGNLHVKFHFSSRIDGRKKLVQ
jgi:hypothetical protein